MMYFEFDTYEWGLLEAFAEVWQEILYKFTVYLRTYDNILYMC